MTPKTLEVDTLCEVITVGRSSQSSVTQPVGNLGGGRAIVWGEGGGVWRVGQMVWGDTDRTAATTSLGGTVRCSSALWASRSVHCCWDEIDGGRVLLNELCCAWGGAALVCDNMDP